MTMHRFSDQSDDQRSAIQPVRTRQFVSSPAAVHNGRDNWSAPDDVRGQRLLLTVSEAAQQLGIGSSLLYEPLAEGELGPSTSAGCAESPSTPRRLHRQAAPEQARGRDVSSSRSQSNLAASRHHQGRVQ
jgi:hypothetical protein